MENFEETILPSQTRPVLEEGTKGVYEIDGLYAGYGYTLGNSLRRLILSSLPGAAITTVKIDGVNHEFSTIGGIKEDVVTILLNLKQIRIKLEGNEPQKMNLSVKGQKNVTAEDFKVSPGLEILNKDLLIATLTEKNSKLEIEATVEKGLGYVPKEILKKEKVETGVLMLDASFTPIRRVNYEVENMRVGERTDYNRLRFVIETDGSISPREALEQSIKTLIKQLSAVVNISDKKAEEILAETKRKQEEAVEEKIQKKLLAEEKIAENVEAEEKITEEEETKEDYLKTRVEDLNFSNRTHNSLSKAGIRTVGGLARKKEEDLLKIDGIGAKAINEIRRALGNFGLILK